MASPFSPDSAESSAPHLVLPPLPTTPRIQLYEILNGETGPPFTFPAFIAYMNKQHAEENVEFYDAVVQYRKSARQLSNRITQQQQQRELASGTGSPVNGGSQPSPSQGLPPNGALFAAVTGGRNNSRRRSSVFVSIAEMESNPLMQSNSAGGSGGRRRSIGIQSAMLFESSQAVLPNGSQLKALLELQDGGAEGEEARILTERLGKLREKLERIVELFLNEGAPKEINIPGNLRDQLLHEIRDNRNYDPRIFKTAMENLYNSMKGNLMGFVKEGEKLLKTARSNAIKIAEDDIGANSDDDAIPAFLAGPAEFKAVEMKRDQRRRMSTVPDFVRTGPPMAQQVAGIRAAIPESSNKQKK